MPAREALLLPLLLAALAGCRAPLDHRDVVRLPETSIRGVRVGDLLPASLAPLPVIDDVDWRLRSADRVLGHQPRLEKSTSDGSLFLLRQLYPGDTQISVLALPEGDRRRVRAFVFESTSAKPATWGPREPREVVGVLDQWYALRRTDRPGTFVIVGGGRERLETYAEIVSTDDLPSSGLLRGLLPAEAPEGWIHADFDAGFARALAEGWSYERTRPLLAGYARLARAAIRPLKDPRKLDALVAARGDAWARELASLSTTAIVAREDELLVDGAHFLRDAIRFRGAVVSAHVRAILAGGRPYTAAGAARMLVPKHGYWLGAGEPPTPTAREILAGSAAPLPPVDAPGEAGAFVARAIPEVVTGVPFPARAPLPGEPSVRIDIEEEDGVTVGEGVFARESVHREDSLAYFQWRLGKEALEREIAAAEEQARANQYFYTTETYVRADRKKTVYVGRDGEEVGRTSEITGTHEETVVTGVNAAVKGLHEEGLRRAAEKRRALAEHAKREPPKESVERFQVYRYRFQGPVRWRVRASGLVEETCALEATAEDAIGQGGWREGPGLRSIGVDAARRRLATQVAERLAARLAKLREDALRRHVEAIPDPRLRAEEAAWRRFWMDEAPAPGDAAFVPVEKSAREALRRRIP